MAKSRYAKSRILSDKDHGKHFDAWPIYDNSVLFVNNVENGLISYKAHRMKAGERLDTLAYRYYGNGEYWWIIALANRIGWALQVTPGKEIYIPDLNSSLRLLLG